MMMRRVTQKLGEQKISPNVDDANEMMDGWIRLQGISANFGSKLVTSYDDALSRSQSALKMPNWTLLVPSDIQDPASFSFIFGIFKQRILLNEWLMAFDGKIRDVTYFASQ